MKMYFHLILIGLLATGSGFAQMVQQNESFESATPGIPPIFPSPGWRIIKYPSATNAEFRVQSAATAVNPTCGSSPGGGANLMIFNSFTASDNDTALIITKPFDFSNNSGVNPQFSFYMYRDNGFLANDDHIRVYINSTPSLSGATLLTNTLGTTQVFRRNNGSPVATANTWNQYFFDLTASSYTQNRYYFILMGVCKDGNNIYIDQVKANTYPSPMNAADVSMNLFLQNSGFVSPGTSNNMVVGMRCIVGGSSGTGVVNGTLSTAVKLDSILMNTNGTTNVSDISNAKVYYTGGSMVFDTNYVSPFPSSAGSDGYPARRFGQTYVIPGTNLDFVNSGSSCFYLEYDTTYFWLTYDIKANAVNGNLIDAGLRRIAVGGSPGTCPSPASTGISISPAAGGFTLPGNGTIDLTYCTPVYYSGTSGNNFNYTNNDYLQSVTINGALGTTINTALGASNNNNGLPASLPCYPNCDFTAHPPDYELWDAVPGRTVALNTGLSYSISVQAGTWYSANYIAGFIDYNHDGDFSDAGEKIFQSPSLTANTFHTAFFVVPGTAATGLTRMRIREVWASTNIDPCATYGSGETEDFIISILPNCPAGYKLWLGNTDDWNNSLNWCGGIPAITDDAVIDVAQLFPPAGVPSRPYYYPVIKSTVAANCNNLTISTLDTLLINAASPAVDVLKVRSNLNNYGKLQVNNSDIRTVTMGSGTISNSIQTPFKALSTDARMQLIYSAAELSQAGLIAGDRISRIQFSLSFKASTAPYTGFTVSYALVPFSQHASGNPYAGPLTTLFGPASFSTVTGANTLLLNTPATWDGSSNLLIQFCFDNASNIGSSDDRLLLTETTGIKSTLLLSTVVNAGAGCTLLPGAGVSDNFFSTLGSYRPNLFFQVERPYSKAQIRVQGDWLNNGSFVAGYSRVLLDSTLVQNIGGTVVTTFSELEVNKGNAAQTISLFQHVQIDTTFILTQGSVLMNTKSVTMNNPALSGGTIAAPTGPFTRINGFLISGDSASSVIWKNVTSLGFRIIPFGSEAITSPQYIPFSYNLKSGVLGDLTVSTYKAPGNLPWPPGVSHFNPSSGPGNNEAAAVDRFWIVEKTGTSPVADLTFRFANAVGFSERPIGMGIANPGRAQAWKNGIVSDRWLRLLAPYTSTSYTQNYGTSGSFDSVRVVNWNWPVLPTGPAPYFEPTAPVGNKQPWTITLNTSPCGEAAVLPVQISVISIGPETCPGNGDGTVTLSVSGGSSPYSYLWSDGNISQNRSGLTAGTYSLTVTDANGSSADTTITITVANQFPATPSTITGPTNGVCGGIKNYYVTKVPGISFTWSVPAGLTIVSGQGTDSVLIQFSSVFSTAQISVTASNICGNSSVRTKTIKGWPKKPASISGPSAFCNTDTVTFSTPVISGTTSYIWNVPIGVLLLNGQNTNTITVTGVMGNLTGDICVKAKNSCGTSANYCKSLQVDIAPQPISSITGSANGVCGQTITYSVSNISGLSYNWTIPSGAVLNSGQGSHSISVSYSTSNITGSVSVTSSGSCGPDVSKSKTIRSKPLAPTGIIGPGNVCYNQQSVSYSCPAVTGANWYDWTIPPSAGFVSGQGTTSILINFNGIPGTTEQVKVRSANACGFSGNEISNIILNNCPRMADKEVEFDLHPNPATNQVLITWNNEREEAMHIRCIDILGKTVIAEQIPSGSGAQQLLLNTGALSSGVYIIRLQAGEETVQSKKLVIE